MSTNFDPKLWQQADVVLVELLDIPESLRSARLEEMRLQPKLRKCVDQLLMASQERGLLDSDSLGLSGVEGLPMETGLLGRRFGHYLLESLIGHGGMSTVYRARRSDGSFEEPVAVKVLNCALLATDWKERFQREAQFLSQLRHPGIATLIDAGVSDDGTPYLVTELVEGKPIHKHCDDAGLDLRERVKLIIKLCEAVAFAQSRLFVHRDIKPENVLVASDGRVKLIDFGIAKQLAVSGVQTTMTRAYSPGYAAPEQLSGEPVTTATDVFSIGALLYRLLTGEQPFETSPGELSAGARKNNTRFLKSDLHNIVRKAMDERPEGRYANAEALSDDLRAWLEHRPVRARPPSLFDRLRLFWRRRTALASALSALMVVALLGIVATLWQAQEARTQAEQAQLHAEQAIAESRRAQATRDFLVQLFEANAPDVAQGNMPTSRDLLDLGAHQIGNSFSDTPALRADMLVLLGDLYRQIGAVETARSLLHEGVELAAAENLDAVEANGLIALANLYRYEGQKDPFMQALDRVEAMLSAAGKVPGETHARAQRQLLGGLRDLGMGDEELRRAAYVLDLARADPGLASEALLNYLVAYGQALLFSERLEEAESALTEAMALEVDGGIAPSLRIQLLTALSGIYTERGQLLEALPLEQEALAVAERIYPEGHLGRASLLANLGWLLSELGRLEESVSALQLALQIMEQVLQQDTYLLATVHNNLANTLNLGGDYEGALPHFERAIQIIRDMPGDDNLTLATILLNHSNSLLMLDRPHEAAESVQWALEIRKAGLGEDHVLVATTHAFLVGPYLAMNTPEHALEQADAALSAYRASGWDSPRDLMVAYMLRARALKALTRIDEASASYMEAISIAEAAPENVGVRWPRVHLEYAEFMAEQRPAEAGPVVVRALEVNRDMQGPDHPGTLRLQALVEELVGHAAN